MKTLLIAGFILLISVATNANGPYPFDRMQGLGKDRESLSPEMIYTRAEALKKASEFWLLRMSDAKDAPARIFGEDLWSIIQVSAAEHQVDPYILAGLIFVESFGKADAVSPTGPRGILQFTARKAKEVGLKMRYETRKIKTVKYRGRGKKRRAITVWRKVRVLAQDDRLIPALAIPAGARSLRASYRIYGRWDFAIQEHHNGNGRVRRMVALYLGMNPRSVNNKNVGQLIADNNLSFAQVFFDNTPYHRVALNKYMEEIKREADYAPTYSFRVLQAADLMRLYEENSSVYDARFASYRSRFKENGVAPSRMWYFFDPETFKQLQFQNLVAIQEASKIGRLVPLPEPWNDFGYDVRLHGPSAIGEKDLRNQREYIQAEPGTVGALIAILHEVKLLQGGRFRPYEINSLVRTYETQEELLDDPGTQASRALPTHTLGKAFDFPVRGLDTKRLNDLLFILSDMDSMGMISYVLERRTEVYRKCRRCRKRTRTVLATIHVVPHPQWETYFRTVYRQATGQPEDNSLVTQ